MDFFYWFALKSVPYVGNVTFRRLLERFGDPEIVFQASARDLTTVKGMHAGSVSSIVNRDTMGDAEKECQSITRAGVRIITFLSPQYPKTLLEVPDHPPFLYVKGTLRADELSVAIVGSRRASNYGATTAERLARDLSTQGITIVSGLARGIDTAAHRGALRAEGRSVGVLGCGIDIVYPRENQQIFNEIQNKGALVSEFPMGTEPRAENFPRRNRIISGISRGVLVVEAAKNSGSLITAQYALEQGREVFAIPGNINYAGSRGSHSLIKQGAKLVECVEDILEELPQARKAVNARVPDAVRELSPLDAKLVTLLAPNPLHIDEIITKSALTAPEVSAILLRLELNGLITQLPGMYFQVA
jgi:DNA processing protein